MEAIFINLLNISISASWLIIAVILFRQIFKNVPKSLMYFLWAFVALKLMNLVSFESSFSLVPSIETIPQNIGLAQNPAIYSGIEVLNSTINPILSSSMGAEPASSINPMQVTLFAFSNIWLIGMVLIALYSIISYLKLKNQVLDALKVDKNIYETEKISSPFVLGFLSPKIYLPLNMDDKTRVYVIAHEKSHITYKDYIIKPFIFALTTIYWFNPLVWVSYILISRDIELACDERVIKEYSKEEKASYSNALLLCSTNPKFVTACPIAFGELGVKARIKKILNYKEPAFWVVGVAVVTSLVLAVCFFTNPKSDERLNYTMKVSDETLNATIEVSDETLNTTADVIPANLFTKAETDSSTAQLKTKTTEITFEAVKDYTISYIIDGEIQIFINVSDPEYAKLFNELTMAYYSVSMAFEAMNISECKEYYIISSSASDGTELEYYAYMFDNRPVLQRTPDSLASYVPIDLYDSLVNFINYFYINMLSQEEIKETTALAEDYFLNQAPVYKGIISIMPKPGNYHLYQNKGIESEYEPGNIIIYEVITGKDEKEGNPARTISIARENANSDWIIINQGF